MVEDLRSAFSWVLVHDRAYARAWEVQGELASLGQHRGAGPVDLLPAATAELFGLTLLHHDQDFATIARVTGQALRWYGVRLVRLSAKLAEVRPRGVCPGRRGVAQLGSALRSGRRGRRFKSGHPDQVRKLRAQPSLKSE